MRRYSLNLLSLVVLCHQLRVRDLSFLPLHHMRQCAWGLPVLLLPHLPLRGRPHLVWLEESQARAHVTVWWQVWFILQPGEMSILAAYLCPCVGGWTGVGTALSWYLGAPSL